MDLFVLNDFASPILAVFGVLFPNSDVVERGVTFNKSLLALLSAQSYLSGDLPSLSPSPSVASIRISEERNKKAIASTSHHVESPFTIIHAISPFANQ